MSFDDLFKSRAEKEAMEASQARLEDLLRQLAGKTDPEEILRTARQIERAASVSGLPAEDSRAALSAAFVVWANSALADGELPDSELFVLPDLMETLGLDGGWWVEMGQTELLNRILIARLNSNGPLIRECESGLIPEKDEYVVYEAHAELLREDRRFRGQAVGFSVRVAPGVRLHWSTFEGAPAIGPNLVVKDRGPLVVTTKRVVFLGDNSSIKTPFNRIIGIEVLKDGVRFQFSHRERVDLYRTVLGPTVAAHVNWLLAGEGSGAAVSDTQEARPAAG